MALLVALYMYADNLLCLSYPLSGLGLCFNGLSTALSDKNYLFII